MKKRLLYILWDTFSGWATPDCTCDKGQTLLWPSPSCSGSATGTGLRWKQQIRPGRVAWWPSRCYENLSAESQGSSLAFGKISVSWAMSDRQNMEQPLDALWVERMAGTRFGTGPFRTSAAISSTGLFFEWSRMVSYNVPAAWVTPLYVTQGSSVSGVLGSCKQRWRSLSQPRPPCFLQMNGEVLAGMCDCFFHSKLCIWTGLHIMT